jgi:predicted transcriptional regulator|tara:strand:+ start:1797 stop:1979 length:183 start_codon:yes stop_codon:yes gene_type:complete
MRGTHKTNQSIVKLLYNTLKGDLEQGKETVFNEGRQIEWTTLVAEKLSEQGYTVPEKVNE